jgi:PAS domain-containing protein
MVRLLAAGGTGTSQHDRPVVLRLPLRALEPRDLAPESPAPLPRTLDLEPGALLPWLAAVTSSEDACLVVDAEGRLAAASPAASVLLDLDDDRVGTRFADLVCAVDFSLGARPELDQQGLPPLQALESGRTARALLRLRHRDAALVTLDVASVPLARRVGSLTFLQQV